MKGKKKKKNLLFAASISFLNSPSPPYPTTLFPFAQPTGKCRPIPEMGSLVRSPTDHPLVHHTTPERSEFGRNLSAGSFFGWGCVSRMSTECAVRAPGSVLEEFACLMSGNVERSQEMCGMEGREMSTNVGGVWGCTNVIRKIVWSVGQIGPEEFLSSQGRQNFVNGNMFSWFWLKIERCCFFLSIFMWVCVVCGHGWKLIWFIAISIGIVFKKRNLNNKYTICIHVYIYNRHSILDFKKKFKIIKIFLINK